MKCLPRAVLLIIAFLASPSLAAAEEDVEAKHMHSQLTIYVSPALQQTGGTVIVVSNPVTAEAWRNLPRDKNPARDDASNQKQKDVGPGDRLLGVVVSTKVSIVEFVYPEGGSFGFNLVPLPAEAGGGPAGSPLATKRVLVGSGGWTNWQTGKSHIWDDVSTIHVVGSDVTEANSRGASVAESKIMNLGPPKTTYEGAIVHAPTSEQLSEVLDDIPQ